MWNGESCGHCNSDNFDVCRKCGNRKGENLLKKNRGMSLKTAIIATFVVVIAGIAIFLAASKVSDPSSKPVAMIFSETNAVSMKKGESKSVVLTLSGNIPDGFGLWMEWSGAVSAEWVDWGENSGKNGPITIHANENGTGQIIVHLADRENNDMDTTIIKVNVVS